MKITKILALGFILTLSSPAIGQNYIKAVAVKVSDSLGLKLDEYVGANNKDLIRNKFLDYCAFERADYFISVLEATSKARKKSIWECGKEIPRGSQARKAHNELFGNPDFFVESKVPYVKTFRDFEEQNLQIQSEIMVPTFWENEYSKRKSLEEIIKKTIGDHSNKTGTFSGDLLECYKGSKAHNSAILKYGKGQFGISTVILVEEEKLESGWKYSVVVYNVVVFSKPMN